MRKLRLTKGDTPLKQVIGIGPRREHQSIK